MQMLYNSDNYVVVHFDLATEPPAGDLRREENGRPRPQGGYEIVDKFARREIFIDGAMAQSFREGVDALIRCDPTEDQMDEYIARYASLMQQPLVLH